MNKIDNKDVYRFLQLLKRPESSELELITFILIIEEEWYIVIKKLKKRSRLSIFSKHTYSVCKIILESEKMTTELIRFCNLVVREEIVLDR